MTTLRDVSTLASASSADIAADSTGVLPFHATVTKRDGRVVPYDRSRIAHAVEMAFRAEAGVPYPDPLDVTLDDAVNDVAEAVERALRRTVDTVVGTSAEAGDVVAIGIEAIQDEVERQLMAYGHYSVARRFILYREARAHRRAAVGGRTRIRIREADGQLSVLQPAVLRAIVVDAAHGLGSAVDVDGVYRETLASLYDGVTRDEINKALVLAARARTDREPEYAQLAARLRLDDMYAEAIGRPVTRRDMTAAYEKSFADYLERGISCGRLDPRLRDFDLPALAAALRPDRDLAFSFMGVQTLYDRYLIHDGGRRIELPQWFWMRVSMGLALGEPAGEPTDEPGTAEAIDAAGHLRALRVARAIEFYDTLSTFSFCSSTPTLFNAGTRHPQLSSCFLTTVQDDLGDIFKAIRDNAMLSKWSGGLGNDWTNVRAMGSHIGGTNGESQGIIPFLKVANDTAVAVNQGGKRQGATCAYLETWHLDLEEFLELRKNTGDDRRRTHDMNTANWIPDLFMQRVREESHWTLFSPSDVPDLHDLYGAAFGARYVEYERAAEAGTIRHKRVRAVDLWRKMLAMLFETGHPWITFKDPSNIRSPQDHVGVVHSSNLCTEILLNTSRGEVAVCNLGSINLVAHITPAGIDREKLARTVTTAVRMLDNVIDINLYPVPEARAANVKHRPVGLGIMGFQDALSMLGHSYASDEAVEFADESMELISYHAILASASLARERGAYESYRGSKWDRELLPVDTLDLLARERGVAVPVPRAGRLDWTPVRDAIRAHGMRNSNVLAIAPTATIANICDVSASIEPAYKHLFVKSNLSGDFATMNRYLVDDLRARGVWNASLAEDLKFHDGSVQEIDAVPADLKVKYLTAFEVEPEWLIACAARRQKWIDMGQSLNLYLDTPSGRRLNEMYLLAWELGLKTTYYLRTLGAGGVEKSTLDINRRGIQPRWMKSQSASASVRVTRGETVADERPDARLSDPSVSIAPGRGASCSLDGGDCEACQ